jgi:hypothetical protein
MKLYDRFMNDEHFRTNLLKLLVITSYIFILIGVIFSILILARIIP